jgi:hypothetical protein
MWSRIVADMMCETASIIFEPTPANIGGARVGDLIPGYGRVVEVTPAGYVFAGETVEYGEVHCDWTRTLVASGAMSA